MLGGLVLGCGYDLLKANALKVLLYLDLYFRGTHYFCLV